MIAGFKKGFLQELFKLLRWVFSYVLAKILAGTVAIHLYDWLGIEAKLLEKLNNIANSFDFTSIETLTNSVDNGISSLPYIGKFLEGSLKGNWSLTELYQSGVSEMKTKLIELIMDEVTPVAMSMLETISFVLLFIVLAIVLGVIFNCIIKVTHNSKLLGAFDGLMGGILGGLKGLIIFVLIFAILFVIATLTGSEYLTALESSRFFDIIIGIKDVIPK